MNLTSTLIRQAWWRITLLGACSVLLAGCLLQSPYWGQTFSTRTTPVPIQAWTTDKNHNVKIECSKAYHGGLYPAFGPETWYLVTDITPSANPSYDSDGSAIYSAGVKLTLPAACWYEDSVFGKHMTALRATQLTASGSTTVYRVFNKAGLECVGRENGKDASWFSWLIEDCAMTYSNSDTLIPWVRIMANS